MTAWRIVASELLLMLGIAAVMIAGISLIIAATTPHLGEAADAEHDGLQIGTVGLLLIAAGAAVRFS